MRSWLRLAVIALSFSAPSLQASLIQNGDIDSIVIETPEKWTGVNESVLFDGISLKRKSERFIGFRNDGEELSPLNTFSIIVTLNRLFDIDSFGFFNDWGYHLQQQVASIRVSLFDANATVAYSVTRNDVKLDTFDIINVFTTNSPVKDIKYVTFDILKIQETNFEIREFVLSYTGVRDNASLSAAQISSPTALSLFTMFLIFLGYKRFKLR